MRRFTAIAFILILILGLSACAKKEQTVLPAASEPAEPEEKAPVETLTLHMQLVTERDEPCSYDTVNFRSEYGSQISVPITNGEFTVTGLPVTRKISGELMNGADASCMFFLSFWTGYSLAYHNNLNVLSIDLPANTQEIYLKAEARESSKKLTCFYISQYSFDVADSEAEEAYGIDEEAAAAAGLYGVKYASETGINLRSEPNSESESVGKLEFAERVLLMNKGETAVAADPEDEDAEDVVEAPEDETADIPANGEVWYKVRTDSDLEGYVRADLLGKKYTITKNGVNIRTQPTAESDVVYAVGTGTNVIALDDGQKDDRYRWYHIKTKSGYEGYIRSDFMALTE